MGVQDKELANVCDDLKGVEHASPERTPLTNTDAVAEAAELVGPSMGLVIVCGRFEGCCRLARDAKRGVCCACLDVVLSVARLPLAEGNVIGVV